MIELIAGLLLVLGANAVADAAAPARVEAKSQSFLAVGVVQGSEMSIHLSRRIDNAPVHDASVEVGLRALKLTAVAQTDGSYRVKTPELSAGGPAVVVFTVSQNGNVENMSGNLDVAETSKKLADNGQLRQVLWWVLNFAVCIGFLVLYSRRSKAAEAPGED